MNQVVPMGYAKTRMGTSLAVVIATGTGLLTWLFVKNGAAFSDVKYFCMVAAALILVCVFSDVTKTGNAEPGFRICSLCCPVPL